MNLKNVYRKPLAVLVSSLFLLTSLLCLTPQALSEAPGLTVTKAGGAVLSPDNNGVYTLTSGSYTIAGSTQSQSIKITGDVQVTLQNAEIDLQALALPLAVPAIGITQGEVTLFLEGNNTVKGADGFAGIYVAEAASLTIEGSGSLLARGGKGKNDGTYTNAWHGLTNARCFFSGAAGIGGNSVWVHTNNTLAAGTPGFGTILISSGTIDAEGGQTVSYNCGSGAGIGAAGGSSQYGLDYFFTGTIEITGGTVYAVGGAGNDTSLTSGGAAIGTGGVCGQYFVPYNNAVTVSISGGNVTAIGKGDGAGIGGGANVNGGIIEISGGKVNATGGFEEENNLQEGHWGGAGIGGGDCGGVTSIVITGQADVTAKAIGAAAGIGAGCDGFVGTSDYDAEIEIYGTIVISGQASVRAFGGSNPNKKVGGAGIGAGCSYYYNNGFGTISILENAKIRAYAGSHAQAIGVGSQYEESTAPNSFNANGKNLDVWMFNPDTSMPAFWGQKGDSLTANIQGTEVAWYTLPQDTAFPAADTPANVFSTWAKPLSWLHTAQGTVQLLNKGQPITQCSYLAENVSSLGNWGVFFTAQETGNLNITLSAPDAPQQDFTFILTLEDASVNGTYGAITFTNGTAVFTLKNGQNKTAAELPAGISYKIEAAAADGFLATPAEHSGHIISDQTQQAEFLMQKTTPQATPNPDENAGPKNDGDIPLFSLWLALLAGTGLLCFALKKHRKQNN